MVQLTSAEAAMTTKHIKRGAILLLIIALLAGCTVQNNEGTTDKAPTAAYSEQWATETVVHTTIPETTTVYYTEPATERIDIYYHSCITNSVIYEQDGSDRFAYIDKCDVCGYTGSSRHYLNQSSGSYSTGFYCPNCKENRKVEIKTTNNWS